MTKRSLLFTIKTTSGIAALLLVASTGIVHDRVAAQAPGPVPGLSAAQWDVRMRAFREGLDYIPGELLVKFKDGVGPAVQARVLSLARGGAATVQSQWIHDVMHVTAEREDNPAQLASLMMQQPEVEWAQPNYIHRLHAVPNDAFYDTQWNMTLLDMPRAWDISDGGSSAVTVAVIDTGVTTQSFSRAFALFTGGSQFSLFTIPFAANPDIASSRIAGSRDYTGVSAELGGLPSFDTQGHGSHVAGTVLQETNNSIGLAGMAHRTRLLALKVCVSHWDLRLYYGAYRVPDFLQGVGGGCSTDAELRAIYDAIDSGAQVANMSLGGPSPSPASLTALRDAVQSGMFVAISAGNEFLDGNPTSYPAAYAQQLDGVMAVGAVDSNARRSYYSNTGTYVEIAAPGGDVRGGEEGGIYQASLNPSTNAQNLLVPRFDSYIARSLQGTSMASPHVAGLAALLASRGVSNPAAIEAAIKRFAVDLGTAGPDREYGYGLIDPPATLRGLGFIR